MKSLFKIGYRIDRNTGYTNDKQEMEIWFEWRWTNKLYDSTIEKKIEGDRGQDGTKNLKEYLEECSERKSPEEKNEGYLLKRLIIEII